MGDLKPGQEMTSGLEESLRFTSYSLDPVIGRYFAQARFYDSRCGRLLSPDPVRRGLNRYHYCDNDPVNYEDSTGEIANILIGGAFRGNYRRGVRFRRFCSVPADRRAEG